MSDQLLQQILEKLNQLEAGQKRMESHMETRFEAVGTQFETITSRLDSLDNELKDIKEDVRAVRIESSRAFKETHEQMENQNRIFETLSLRSIEQETEIREMKRIK